MFTCSKVINAFKRWNSWTDTFPKSSKFNLPKFSSQNMRGFHHATILSSSFHGVRKEHLAQWPPISDPKTTKMPRGGTSRKIGWGCATRFLKPLPHFRPKSVIFLTLFQTWSKIWYPISELKPWSPARDKLLRHVHGTWRKHWKGNGLIAKWWRSS